MTYGKNLPLQLNCFPYENNESLFRKMTDNRKRLREDDKCEFMPLSKRINNLHINNLASSSLPQSSDSSQSNGATSENGMPSPSPAETGRRPSYDPGINCSESRYYYENKLLFELHLERLQRTGQQFPY